MQDVHLHDLNKALQDTMDWERARVLFSPLVSQSAQRMLDFLQLVALFGLHLAPNVCLLVQLERRSGGRDRFPVP